jgi:indole-3-glycerol phosphate synthase
MLRFSQSLKQKKTSGLISVIPDIKLFSPKEGNLFHGRDPVKTARQMEKLGAPAISVVTEPKNFGGSMKLLENVVAAVSIPVLRKDFITDEDELRRTKDSGAAAVLLICACLSADKLKKLYDMALCLSLEPLVEVCTRDELILASNLGAKLIGINNRDILFLERDEGSVFRTLELAVFVPQDVLFISESGIGTPEQARTAIEAGASAVLVGTAIWKASDIRRFYEAMCRGESGKEE